MMLTVQTELCLFKQERKVEFALNSCCLIFLLIMVDSQDCKMVLSKKVGRAFGTLQGEITEGKREELN